MKIVVACDGVVSLYTMVSNVEMLIEEIGIKNIHIEQCSLEEVKNIEGNIYIADSNKIKEEFDKINGMVILLNNTMDKQEITLKLLEAFGKLGIIKE
ncbi:MAG: hypothetical protein ACRDD2_13845 [Sarcina sp.]